ncbi:MAG: hypothetical protein IT365_27120 [Candidatus Hydrogenedentes bacterium]|nr:hypothetical protein [Candidatus Hydrogenedentota bacterium]
MKHIRPKSKKWPLPLPAQVKETTRIMDPCAGLTGFEQKKCECKAYKGGVVY